MSDKHSKKKPATGDDNPGRKNGKAWKGGLPPEKRTPRVRTRTPERQVKDETIRAQRERTRQLNIERAAQEQQAREERELREAALAEEREKAKRAERARLEAIGKMTGVARKKG